MREGATAFPQAIGLAASFDTALVGRVARATAREAGSRGIRQVLSPVINLATDVRWGRVEETYGEDPVLTSRMGVAFVSAFEAAGIIATPKHFIANVGEGGRDSYPIDFSKRLLEEMYYPSFDAATSSLGHAQIGDERVQLGGWFAGDAEPGVVDRKAQARLELSRFRDLGRGGDRGCDRTPSHRGDDCHSGQRRARRRDST